MCKSIILINNNTNHLINEQEAHIVSDTEKKSFVELIGEGLQSSRIGQHTSMYNR